MGYMTFCNLQFYMLLRKNKLNLSVNFPFLCFHFIFSLSDLCSQFHFQLGSCVSIYGCRYKHNKIDCTTVNRADLDTEEGTYVAPTLDGTPELPNLYKNSNANQEPFTRNTAGVWGYIFQITFQVIFVSSFYWSIFFFSITFILTNLVTNFNNCKLTFNHKFCIVRTCN